MLYLHIPEKQIYDSLVNVLATKYGLKFHRRFIGFRVETGNAAVNVVNMSNVNYIAYRVSQEIKNGGNVVEIFRNNSSIWSVVEDK